jgi:tRNA-splicing ligase RtcB
MTGRNPIPLERIDDVRWRIPLGARPGMRVPGLIYADAALLETIRADQALEQVANVATLPGIVGYSYAMPDIHWGYGFPIGGVAAMRLEDGVVSPGGVGFDINCGARLVRSDLTAEEVQPHLRQLLDLLFRNIPPGMGAAGRVRPVGHELDDILQRGARWAVEKGYGLPDDLECAEENGGLAGADPTQVSERAKTRGRPQLGTLGSGNHFLEIQAVERVFDQELAATMGIDQPGQIVVMVHCGSRGLGHQVCQETLKTMEQAVKKYS